MLELIYAITATINWLLSEIAFPHLITGDTCIESSPLHFINNLIFRRCLKFTVTCPNSSHTSSFHPSIKLQLSIYTPIELQLSPSTHRSPSAPLGPTCLPHNKQVTVWIVMRKRTLTHKEVAYRSRLIHSTLIGLLVG